MDVLGHDDIAEDVKVISAARGFQRALEETARLRRIQMRLPLVTTEGDEVKVSGVLIADEFLRHSGILTREFPLRVVALRNPRSQGRDLGHPQLLFFRCAPPAKTGSGPVTCTI
jgi:hypothetical protein